MSAPIRRIAVAGSGPIAWIAAAGLLRAMRGRALEVSVVDTGPDAAPVGQWTLPSQRGMHGLLGVNEPHFIHHTGSTFKLATEHCGWQGEGSRFLHAHGEIGTEFEGIPYYKYLLSEAQAGRPAAAEIFSVAGSAARLGRFARPMGEGLTASFTYAFHVEDAPYTRYLRTHALQLGVRESAAGFAEVVLAENGNIAALRLVDGTLLEADLFVDCSGPAARLVSRISNDRDDWSSWLPCDRILSGVGAALRNPAPVTQTFAGNAGWLWRSPLADRSIVGHVYSSAHLTDQAALAALVAFEPGLRGEAVMSRFSSGRRRDSWVRNCVALGAAAIELEPLAGAGLHVAQLGLATLVELFPLNRESAIEAREFNRVMGEHADALRDFTMAHYRAGRAPRENSVGGFWAAARAAAPPPNLAHKLDLFAASGRIGILDHETFEETDWAWLLVGAGSVPAAIELQTRQRVAKLRPQDIAALRAQIQQVAASMPPHAEFLRHQSSQAVRA